LRSFSEQRLEASRKFTENPAGFIGFTATSAGNLQSGPFDLANERAWQSIDATKEAGADTKNPGGDYVSSLAETIRRAGREFDNDLPIAGKYMRHAAAQMKTLRARYARPISAI